MLTSSPQNNRSQPPQPVDGPQSPKLIHLDVQRIALPTLETAYGAIFNEGMEDAPNEACGLLVNETGGIQIIPLVNRAEDPTASYRIDNETLRSLALKPKTWAHIAVWHTHPGGQVGPSAADLEHRIQTVKYVVITIPTGEVVWF